MRIRIDGHDLPGLDCSPGPGFAGQRDIHVGVQRRNRPAELIGVRPADAAELSWTLDCAHTGRAEPLDLLGPAIQGGPGARFIYLSWLAGPTADRLTMFRRAKLLLTAVPPATATAALATGLLVGRLRLTGPEGRPLCVRVVPPLINWTAGEVS